MEAMEMSLEDIIKTKKPTSNRPFRKPTMRKEQKPFDARNKIIQKKRQHITDARDKLAELARTKDARLKLEQNRMKRGKTNRRANLDVLLKKRTDLRGLIRSPLIGNVKGLLFKDPRRQVQAQPLQRSHIMNRSERNIGYATRPRLAYSREHSPEMDIIPPVLKRTIRNEVNPFPPPPIPIRFNIDDEPDIIVGRTKHKNLKIIARNDFSSKVPEKAMYSDKITSPLMPPSILKKRPSVAAKDKRDEPAECLEYRIIVSNLGSTVTESDIQELFADVGGLVESRLVRPGTAEVLYRTLDDAEKAVNLYHNRQLDGQPMNCFLVNPSSSNKLLLGKSSSGKAKLPASTSSNVVPDISTFHKVLFANR